MGMQTFILHSEGCNWKRKKKEKKEKKKGEKRGRLGH